jgi:ankyrin repeat protein
MLFRLKRLKLDGDNLVKYAEKGNYKVVEYLIRKGVHPDTKNKRNRNALDKAVKNRHWKIARLLIESGVTMPPWYTNYATTPLIWAVGEGLYGYVESLINEGIDITVSNNKGKTPLMSAAGRLGHSDNSKEHFLAFKLLLDHPDVDVNAKTKFGRTALMDAARGETSTGLKCYLIRVRIHLSGQTLVRLPTRWQRNEIIKILWPY